MNRRVATISWASGILWGGIGFWLLDDMTAPSDHSTWIGLIVSPAIGVLMGWLAARFDPKRLLWRVLYALAAVYIACGLFLDIAAAMSSFSGAYTSGVPAPLSRMNIESMVIGAVFGPIWLLTASGWAFILWPVSFANHMLIWRKPSGKRIGLNLAPGTWHPARSTQHVAPGTRSLLRRDLRFRPERRLVLANRLV